MSVVIMRYHASSDWEFHDTFAFFVLDDDTADIAFFDKLLDFLDKLDRR